MGEAMKTTPLLTLAEIFEVVDSEELCDLLPAEGAIATHGDEYIAQRLREMFRGKMKGARYRVAKD